MREYKCTITNEIRKFAADAMFVSVRCKMACTQRKSSSLIDNNTRKRHKQLLNSPQKVRIVFGIKRTDYVRRPITFSVIASNARFSKFGSIENESLANEH